MAVGEVTTIDVVNAFVGGVGLLLALVGLGWQAYTWRRSTHRVQVSVRGAVGPFGDDPYEPETAYSVSARNVGRAAVQVTHWYFVMGKRDGQGLWATRPLPGNAPLPVTLDPGASVIWYMRCDEVHRIARENGHDTIFGAVDLGTGETVLSSACRL